MTQVVIFCGGKGTRLWPNTETGNKHMIEVGGRPILWHVMKIYSSQEFNDFILCLGAHGDKIKNYFSNTKNIENYWKINFVDTGNETLVGGRLRRIKQFITDDNFFATYGDGLSNVNMAELLKFHKKQGKIATLTAVKLTSQYGILEINDDFTVKTFREKPILDYWINGGFFVFNRRIFDYLEISEDLENDVFRKLTEDNQLSAYKHNGFWKSMDTFKDALQLNSLWDKNAPWAVWKRTS